MLLLTRAPAPPEWRVVLASPDERLLWAILAVFALAVLAGLWLRRRPADLLHSPGVAPRR